MNKQTTILLFTLLSALFVGHFLTNKQSKTTPNISKSSCNASLWNHVYNPQRLKIIDQCKTVSGTIESINTEKDGDYHIRLKLDPQYSNLINPVNIQEQHGDLVLEPICENPVEQPDAKASCQNFRGNVTVPSVGTHVKVTGSYVLDKQHGWTEIHPVTTLTTAP